MKLLTVDFNTELIIIVSIVIGAAAVILALKTIFDHWSQSAEAKEIKADFEANLQGFIAKLKGTASEDKTADTDTLSQMEQNITELREYYVISKKQCRITFSAAMMACILGFALFAIGILISYDPENTTVIDSSTIGGAIVEVIAGLFFWMYSKSLDQLNYYYEGLSTTQNSLSAIQLAEKMDEPNRDQAFAYIITKLMDKEQQATLTVSDTSAGESESLNNGELESLNSGTAESGTSGQADSGNASASPEAAG